MSTDGESTEADSAHDDHEADTNYNLPVEDGMAVLAVHGETAARPERLKWRSWLRRYIGIYLSYERALTQTDNSQQQGFANLWEYFVNKSSWRGLNSLDAQSFDEDWLYEEVRSVINSKLKRDRAQLRKEEQMSNACNADANTGTDTCSYISLNRSYCTKRKKDKDPVSICETEDCKNGVHNLCFEGAKVAMFITAEEAVPLCLACLIAKYPKGPCPTCEKTKGLGRKTSCPVCHVHVRFFYLFLSFSLR